MKLAFTYIAFILLLGCNNEVVVSSTDLEKYILKLPEVEVKMINLDLDKTKVNSILSNIENSIPEKIIFIDHTTWSIFMAKKDGTLLDKVGGEGRGPGEFLVINNIYTYTEEGILQILDKKNQRLTYYNIIDDSLQLKNIVSLPNYGQYYLQSVFKSKGNSIGIFRVLRQQENRAVENKLYVYYLDEELKMKEKLLEIEGSELIEVEQFNNQKRFTENIFGNKTVWSFDNDQLYYSNAKNLNFKVFSFNDREVSEHKISPIPENINTSETIDFMMNEYSMIFSINPEYESYFNNRKVLPYFRSIYTSNSFLYIPLTRYGDNRGYILRFNIESKEMERIETPPNFSMKGVNQSGIYGVTVEDDFGNLVISILEFQ